VRSFLTDSHIYQAMTPCRLVNCYQRCRQLQEVQFSNVWIWKWKH